jgi:hypothetical protein
MSIFETDYPSDKRWLFENGFYLTSSPARMAKLIAHYDLYRQIVELPGHVVECGVFKGTSLIRFCTFREMLEAPWSRKIIGFDAFGKFPTTNDATDTAFIEAFEQEAGDGLTQDDIAAVLSRKGFDNVELVPGNILETVPRYADEHPELRIALLHVDVDVYPPTHTVLTHFLQRVVPGGLVVFDDYATVAGETAAIEDLLPPGVRIQKLPYSHIPAYIRV